MRRSRPLAPTLVRSLAAISAFALSACPGSEEGLGSLSVSLAVAPTTLTFDPLYGGSPALASLVVTNVGGAPARLVDARVTNQTGAGVDLTLSPAGELVPAGGSLAIRVTAFAATTVNGLAIADLALDFDDDGTLVVPFVATVLPPPSCDDDNPCTDDTFVDGACRNTLHVDGTPCDDENACTTATLCLGGACVGQAVICDDATDCTVDACSPQTGCVYEPLVERCDDEDPCTDDVCTSGDGCTNPPKDPGALCHFGGCEEIGLCLNGACVMHDVPNGFPCSDDDNCTVGDSCQEGVCAPGPAAESGPEEPRVLVDGLVPTTLCGEGGPCIDLALEPMRVLAAHQRIDGDVQVVWRTAYHWSNGSGVCDPLFAELGGAFGARFIPDDEESESGDAAGACECIFDDDCASGLCELTGTSCGFCATAENPDPAPPPPLPPSCLAGVFLTTGDADGVTTQQLASVPGAVAAALVDTASASAQVLLARMIANDSGVLVDAFTGAGTLLDTRYLSRHEGPIAWPIGALAIDASATRVAVVALPPSRDAFNLLNGCEDVGLCLGVRVETWNAGIFDIDGTDELAPLTPVTRVLNEWPDPRCATALGTTRPLAAHDLQVSLDDDEAAVSHVALRMDPFACGDMPGNTVLSTPRLYRFSVAHDDDTLLGDEILPKEHGGPPWILSIDHVDGTAARTPSPAGVVSYDTCDPENGIVDSDEDPSDDAPCNCLDCDGCPCPCAGEQSVDTCTRTAIVRLQTEPSLTVDDTLFSNLAPGVSEAHTVVVDDTVFTVARTGNVLSLLGRTDEGDLVYKPAPALPSGGRWLDRLVAGSTLVAGLVEVWSGDVLLPVPIAEEPPPPQDPIPSTWVVTQGFACGAEADTPPPFVCTFDVDCPGGLICDRTACGCIGEDPCDAECVGVCLAPLPVETPDDAGVTNLCLDDADCGGGVCIFGEVCITDASCASEDPVICACYGTCADVLVDAGPSDAGSSDAGAVDAGSSDAGSSDGGALDAGSSDDGGALDAGATDAGLDDAGDTDAG